MTRHYSTRESKEKTALENQKALINYLNGKYGNKKRDKRLRFLTKIKSLLFLN